MSEFSIVIKPRDLDILRSLLESRILTLGHVAALHFDGSKDAAKQRLRKLKIEGLIAERRRRVNEPAILFLSRKAFPLLKSEGILQEYPALSIPSLIKRSQVAEATVRHELEVLDVKAAIVTAIRGLAGFTIEEFSTWPILNEFRASPSRNVAPKTIWPDGYIHLWEQQAKEESRYRYFLELDPSSESQEVLAQKCACYTEYYRSGGFAVRNGGKSSDVGTFPFRILIVLKNAERRNNTAARLLQNNPPILRQAYLSTLAEVKGDPLGKIWIRPLDYREATEGTPFEPSRSLSRSPYKRQVERESLVEATIKKHKMLADETEG